MVVLPVDANGNPLIWFIASIPLEDFRHVSQALIFYSLTSRNHHAFSAPYQSKVTTLPVAPYSMILLDVPPTSIQYMVVSPYSNTNIFLLILGGASYSLRFFLYTYFNRNLLSTNCYIYSINCLGLRPWIYYCLVRLSLAMANFNKIVIPGIHYRNSHAPFIPSDNHP